MKRQTRKTPHTLTGGGANNLGSKAKAIHKTLRPHLSWRNPLPYPHLYLGVGKDRRSINTGGRNGLTIKALSNGGLSKRESRHAAQEVFRIKRELGLPVRWQWEWWGQQRYKRYYLAVTIQWWFEVPHAG